MSRTFSTQSGAGVFSPGHGESVWQHRYWWWAAIPMLLMFVFEALQISLFKTAQAPNVSSLMQIALMLGFFLSWIVVPRIIWLQLNKLSSTARWQMVSIRLGLIGIGLSIPHLLLLAGLSRFMYSAPGWGLAELAQSFAEVWLSYAGLWLLVYCLACVGVIFLKKRFRIGQHHAQSTTKLAVKHAGRTLFLIPDDIIWIEADGNYAKIYHDQQIYMLRQSLRSLEQTLPAHLFVRTHRQALVNLTHIQSLKSENGSQTYQLQLKNKLQAPLSRRHLATIKKHLQQGAPVTH